MTLYILTKRRYYVKINKILLDYKQHCFQGSADVIVVTIFYFSKDVLINFSVS